MKKIFLILLVSVLILSLMLGGCTKKGDTDNEPTKTPAVTALETPAVTGTNAQGFKTGIGSVISISKSKNVTDDADALTQADIVMAAVTVDSQGRIVNVKIDTLQSKITFDKDGKITSDIDTPPLTKVELGNEYGMKQASGISKEWFEQIAVLEDWMTGKTIEEIMGMQLSAEGTPSEADLTSSVTIHVGDYINAVQKAVNNAKEFGIEVAGTTKTGLGNIVSLAKSKSAAADAEGLAQTDNVMAAVTVDENGVIVGVMIDSAQVKISVDAQGNVTNDLSAMLKTKVELGDEYGMKQASGIGKEWYEQISSLEQWMVGKTLQEIMGMQLSAEGTPAEADLTSSVTIHVSDYQNAVKEAVETAD